MYAECETAARAEHRGIWQDANAVSPWAFKEARQLPELPKVSPSVQTPPVVQKKKKSGLTSESLSPSFASTGRDFARFLGGGTHKFGLKLDPG